MRAGIGRGEAGGSALAFELMKEASAATSSGLAAILPKAPATMMVVRKDRATRRMQKPQGWLKSPPGWGSSARHVPGVHSWLGAVCTHDLHLYEVTLHSVEIDMS